MDNQERNREALVDHIADQDRILRRRNEQIARQAKQIENQLHNAREAQRVIEEQDDRNYSLAADLALAGTRAEKAEDTLLMVQQQRDHLRATLATTARQRDEADKRAATASPHPLTADDITDEMVLRFMNTFDTQADGSKPAPTLNHFTVARTTITRAALIMALTPPPSRPEGAEELQALIRQAEAEGEGADNEALANYLAAHLTDPTVKEQS